MVHLTYDSSLDANPIPNAIDFLETQFFREHESGSSRQLPEPATLRALRPGQHSGNVVFEDLGLFVKFGQDHKVSIEEAQTMQAMRRAFPGNEIPLPELFGWRRRDGINFIYMSLVAGTTLESAWPTLTEEEKASITDQLRNMIDLLRSIEQNHTEPFIGTNTYTQRYVRLLWLSLTVAQVLSVTPKFKTYTFSQTQKLARLPLSKNSTTDCSSTR